MEIPEPVRRQSLHPFSELPLPVGWKRVEGEYVRVCFHTYPIAQVVEPRGFGADAVDAAVEEARALVREEGKDLLIWWLDPDDAWLGPELERRGLVNQETPGFEAVENAMALVEPPTGNDSPGVVVKLVETIDELAASDVVSGEAFGMPQEMRDELAADRERRFAEHLTAGNTLLQFNASIDDRVVGTAAAAVGNAGINLFAAGVLPDARGRGVYRALIQARWDLAVERGTPALTVQAGVMSRPVVESVGFSFIAPMQIYVDTAA